MSVVCINEMLRKSVYEKMSGQRWNSTNTVRPFINNAMYGYILQNFNTKYLLHMDSDVYAISTSHGNTFVKRAIQILENDPMCYAVRIPMCIEGGKLHKSTFLSLRIFITEKGRAGKLFPVINYYDQPESFISQKLGHLGMHVIVLSSSEACYY